MMIRIPKEFIALATFPGVIVHQMAHMLFCRWMGVAVLDFCYFRLGNPAGYVIHEDPRTFKQSFFIAIGPFLVNTLLGAIISFPGVVPVRKFESGNDPENLLMWLGVSIAMHAFPSKEDADCLWNSSQRFHGVIAQAMAAPLIGLFHKHPNTPNTVLNLVLGVFGVVLLPNAVIYLAA